MNEEIQPFRIEIPQADLGYPAMEPPTRPAADLRAFSGPLR
jgi:hypothetical protein